MLLEWSEKDSFTFFHNTIILQGTLDLTLAILHRNNPNYTKESFDSVEITLDTAKVG